MIESTEIRETSANAITKDLENKPDVKHVKEGLIDFIAGSLGETVRLKFDNCVINL